MPDDPEVLTQLKKLFEDLTYFIYVDGHNFFLNIDLCSAETRDPMKLGHPSICYARPLLCKSKLLKLHILSFHFPIFEL